MGRVLDHYEYTEAMTMAYNKDRGSLSLKMAINAGIVDKSKSTIEEFLQAKNEERENARFRT
jgi:hypothetical protein